MVTVPMAKRRMVMGMAEVEKLIEIYRQLEKAGLMVTAGKKSAAELMVSHDVVPVVRCKDCKYWRDSWVAPDGKHEHGYCYMEECDDVTVGRWGYDFCSYGVRRGDVDG